MGFSFSKQKLTVISILCSFSFLTVRAYVLPQQPSSGKELFEKKCAKCHGKDGTKGAFGAKNLKQSRLDDAAILSIIVEGKKRMPSFKSFTSGQNNSLVSYIKGMRG